MGKKFKDFKVSNVNFVNDLITKDLTNGIDVELTEDFIVILPNGRKVVIPKGFQTDYASIPWFFFRLCPPRGKYNKAAVLHDFLYRDLPETEFADQEFSDMVFLYTMRYLKVIWWRQKIMYRSVVWFGEKSFKAYKGLEIQHN